MKAWFRLATVILSVILGGWPAFADDGRELVSLPPMMQDHMLANMRDHLASLNEILALLAVEKYDQAASVAEKRLGMSSLGLHGAAHMAPYMPEPMRAAGEAMHHAASRFALSAQDADIERSYDGMRNLAGALGEITAACTACHAAYRIR